MVLAADKFESEADTASEDRVRWQALVDYMPIVPPVGWTNIGAVLRQAAARISGRSLPRLVRHRALALSRKLQSNGEAKTTTLASSVTMRRIRIEVIGALIDALAGHPDEELCTITIVKPAWVLTPDQLANISARQIKHAFDQDLWRAGVGEVEGPFVCFLHGEYEPTNNVYVLHYHCTTTRKKAAYVVRRLRRLKRTYRPKGIVKRPIRISKMKNRIGQLTYLLKRYWPSKPILMIEGKQCRRRTPLRVPEPYSSFYLIWLDQQTLLDLTVTKGTWSKRNGGPEAWKRFYLIVGKWSRTSGSAV